MEIICSVYLVILSAYHVSTGILSVFFPKTALKFYHAVYDTNPRDVEQVMLNLKPWGALALSCGVAGLFAASDPVRYIGVVLSLIVLLCLRVYYRFFFRKQLNKISSVSLGRNLLNIGLILAGVTILVSWSIVSLY